MDLRQLRYFVAVAEERNISRAAKKIFLTQPALSRQIKLLEEELGQCLLERQAHSIRLTPAGDLLRTEARGLLEHADQLIERVRTASPGVRLRVGYAPSLAAGLLSAAVESFAQTHPQARVELFDLSTQEMLAGLEGAALDVAITVGAGTKTRGLKWTPLVQAPWRVAVNRHHPLARRARIAAADLADGSLLVFCRRDYPEYWDIVTGWLSRRQLRAKVAGDYDGVDSLMAAVEAGLGVALVTTRMGRLVPEHVRLKTLTDAPPPVCIAAGHRADRADDRALGVFLAELRRAAGALP